MVEVRVPLPRLEHNRMSTTLQRMKDELVTRRANPALRRYVERYWGYQHRAARPARQREPLSTGAVLILGLGPKLGVVARNDPTGPPDWYGSFIAGLDDRCTVIAHEGVMHGIQVDLTPLAARMIFRTPMHSLARAVVPLEDLLGSEARLLEERLMQAPSWERRFELVEAALAGKLAAAEGPPADIEWAWRRLVAASGQLRMADLAAELGCSRKHLAVRFREHVGLPAKLVARMLRFRHASDLMDSLQGRSIAELAALCGYYDQAHLDRDFREFAGSTPTAYLAERVTFVQDSREAAP
jgi:AraC-like DNA-binding protein